jgi:hypothetical protein
MVDLTLELVDNRDSKITQVEKCLSVAVMATWWLVNNEATYVPTVKLEDLFEQSW